MAEDLPVVISIMRTMIGMNASNAAMISFPFCVEKCRVINRICLWLIPKNNIFNLIYSDLDFS